MALLFFDGFDTYADVSATIGLGTRWTNISRFLSGANGRFSGSRAIENDQGFAATARTPTLGSNLTSMAVGFAMRRSAYTGTAGTGLSLCKWLDSAGATQAQLNFDLNGDLVFFRGDAAANLGTSDASRRLVAASWHYIETEIVISDTVGTFKAWIDGVQVFNLSGLDNKATAVVGANFFQFSLSAVGGQTHWFDDFYVTDGTRLGERRVVPLWPTADTATKDWTANSGSNNYDRLDDTAGPDSDTTYVQASSIGNKDYYDITNLPANTLSVDAVDLVMCARKTDVSAREVRANLKSGATTDNGTALTLATTYAMNRKTYLTDPNTATTWAIADVNAIQIGPEITT